MNKVNGYLPSFFGQQETVKVKTYLGSKYLDVMYMLDNDAIQRSKFNRFLDIINSHSKTMLNYECLKESLEFPVSNQETRCICIAILEYYFGSHQLCDWSLTKF